MSKKLYSMCISYINKDYESIVLNCIHVASNKNEAVGIGMSSLQEQCPDVTINTYTIIEVSDENFDSWYNAISESRKV